MPINYRVFDWLGFPAYEPYIKGKTKLVITDSIMPYFPGYKFEMGKSTYWGEEVGEGGYVYAEPGMYGNVAVLDIASMHPSSIVAENLFGDEYTAIFNELLQARLAIKHKDFDKAKKMLGGKLAKYLDDESEAKGLSDALKIAINSVYGLTSARFDNPFRDVRNKDNIVAKRGALFMINLKYFVQSLGFRVIHIKTDSIKIPDATPDLIDKITKYGLEYGYTFEHEDTYDRICLVNEAVYIAKNGKGQWDAVGTQFQVPYVFKTLFSKEPITFSDLCEIKSVTTSLYLDFNEGLPDVTEPEKVRTLRRRTTSNQSANLSKRDEDLLRQYSKTSDEELEKLIAPGHNYQFVGKNGLFCPMVPGSGGGLLVRENPGGLNPYMSATGAKDYRWMETEVVVKQNLEGSIDRSYYDRMVDAAIKDISDLGDFEWFVSDRPYIPNEAPGDLPPWD